MFEAFKEWVNPLWMIARELHIIRELYELELASRETPVIRVTEKPRRDDTEVSYAGDEPEKTKIWKTVQGWGPPADEAEDEEPIVLP